jgi:hypothetical protein
LGVVEEIQKISVKELTTIRIVENGIVHEMSIDVVDRYVTGSSPNSLSAPLRAFVSALQQLSRSPAGIDVEFVVPFKR